MSGDTVLDFSCTRGNNGLPCFTFNPNSFHYTYRQEEVEYLIYTITVHVEVGVCHILPSTQRASITHTERKKWNIWCTQQEITRVSTSAGVSFLCFVLSYKWITWSCFLSAVIAVSAHLFRHWNRVVFLSCVQLCKLNYSPAIFYTLANQFSLHPQMAWSILLYWWWRDLCMFCFSLYKMEWLDFIFLPPACYLWVNTRTRVPNPLLLESRFSAPR